jgi:hypothetical protein
MNRQWCSGARKFDNNYCLLLAGLLHHSLTHSLTCDLWLCDCVMSSDYLIKYGALGLLVVQNAAVALVTSYSRGVTGPKYYSTTAGAPLPHSLTHSRRQHHTLSNVLSLEIYHFHSILLHCTTLSLHHSPSLLYIIPHPLHHSLTHSLTPLLFHSCSGQHRNHKVHHMSRGGTGQRGFQFTEIFECFTWKFGLAWGYVDLCPRTRVHSAKQFTFHCFRVFRSYYFSIVLPGEQVEGLSLSLYVVCCTVCRCRMHITVCHMYHILYGV